MLKKELQWIVTSSDISYACAIAAMTMQAVDMSAPTIEVELMNILF